MSLLAGPRTAVGFLTRIPVRDTAPLTTERFSRAALWFPVVGLLVGAVAGGTRLLGDAAGLPPGPATVLALLAAVLVTGGLHEDGLADTADALGAHTTRERKLEILRDSRVGTFGALAVAYALLFAYASLAGLDGEDVLRAALVGHALGRWSGLPQSLLLPEARPDGSGTLVRAPAAVCIGATVIAVAAALLVAGPGPGAIAVGVAVAVTALGGAVAVRSFGGVSGDTSDATNKLVEVATYAALAASW